MTAEESDDATAESGEDQDDDEFGSRLGDAYRETVGDGTRVDRSEESVDDAVEGASSLDGVGGGPDRVVSDRGVDDVLEEMGDDGESESAGTVTPEADRLEDDAPSDPEPTETSETEPDVEEEQVESEIEGGSSDREIDEEPSADDPDVESPDQTVEDDDETDAEPEAEVEESVDSDGGDDVSTTPSEATNLADVSDSEAAVKRPADEVSQYEDDREDTSSIDDVELSMDDADDVSVPDRTPATSSGDAAPRETAENDEETATQSDDESVGPLTRLVRWFGTLFGGS